LKHTVRSGPGSGIILLLSMERARMSATYDRIRGGSTAQEGEWPWQASLKKNGKHYCGASLISERYLVTAAHCFQKTKDPKNYTVSFGTKVTPPYMQHYVQQIIIHEDYIQGEKHDDIAIILLTEKVSFKKDVHRVCLPEATQIFPPGEGVVVTGWGALSYDVLLQKAPVKIIDTNTCNAQEAYYGMVQDTMLCAGYMEGNIDACQGDSGGPLVHPNSRNIWYLVGVVSWGHDCGKINKPGVYVRVTAYRNWIASKTESTTPCMIESVIAVMGVQIDFPVSRWRFLEGTSSNVVFGSRDRLSFLRRSTLMPLVVGGALELPGMSLFSTTAETGGRVRLGRPVLG
uniref:Peptidase S1 domain-containing protein n=1 Tax=Prolemur simus TaxID=1328070 RepID=A0A8C8ZSG2_PROSS